MKKRILSVFLAVVMTIGFISGGMLSASAVSSYDDLQDAVSSNGTDDIVKLSDDIEGTQQLTIERFLTLDLAGHTLSIDLSPEIGNTASGIRVIGGATLIIEDSVGGGTLNVTNRADNVMGSFGTYYGAGINTTGATLVINGGTINAIGGQAGAGIGGGWGGAGGHITINGGTVYALGGAYCPGIGSGANAQSAAGTFILNGGDITAVAGNNDSPAIGGSTGQPGGDIIINGTWDYWTSETTTPPDSMTGSGEFDFSDMFSYIRLVEKTQSPFSSGNDWTLFDGGLLIINSNIGMNDWIGNGRTTANINAVRMVIIQNGVTGIGPAAFLACKALTEITLPDSVTLIGPGAFEGCIGLTSVTIPGGVTSIGSNAFAYCTGLTRVTFKSQTPPEFGFNVFGNVSSSMTVYVPGGTKAVYQAESQLSGFNIVEGEPSSFPEFKLGDCNNDGRINVADVSYLKRVLTQTPGFERNPECHIAGNLNVGAEDLTWLKKLLTKMVNEEELPGNN